MAFPGKILVHGSAAESELLLEEFDKRRALVPVPVHFYVWPKLDREAALGFDLNATLTARAAAERVAASADAHARNRSRCSPR
jgi:hypothetical protein